MMSKAFGQKPAARRTGSALLVLAAMVGCAGRDRPATPAVAAAAANETPQEITEAQNEEGEASEPGKGEEEEFSLRAHCKLEEPGEDEPLLDESRRRLHETFCTATLWLDGLFGGSGDVDNARDVSGRVELSTLYSEHEGVEPKIRLRLNYDLPTLEQRLNIFLGRGDEEEIVQDRRESFAVRSAFFGLEDEDRWLAGLGYKPPGKWNKRTDFSIGGRLRSAPEIYVKGRYQKNFFVGEDSVIRFRETLFWQNRDGFGTTTQFAMDHLLSYRLLARWSNFGTYAEETEGLEWSSFALLYWNMDSPSDLAFEAFARGATARDVPLKEYGVRAVHRRPMRRKWLFGELIVGYSWPREELEDTRDGSFQVGAGLELHFGRDPY